MNIFYGSLPKDEFNTVNEVADNAIPDVTTASKYADRIYAFYRSGILTGSDAAGTFNPLSNITRSEVAAILTRLYDIDARRKITLNAQKEQK